LTFPSKTILSPRGNTLNSILLIQFRKDIYPVLIARRGREGGGEEEEKESQRMASSCIFYYKKNPQSGVSNKNSRIK
jgi:hypothetical protein